MLENQEKNMKFIVKQKKKKKSLSLFDWIFYNKKIVSFFFNISKINLQNYYLPKLKGKIDS